MKGKKIKNNKGIIKILKYLILYKGYEKKKRIREKKIYEIKLYWKFNYYFYLCLFFSHNFHLFQKKNKISKKMKTNKSQ